MKCQTQDLRMTLGAKVSHLPLSCQLNHSTMELWTHHEWHRLPHNLDPHKSAYFHLLLHVVITHCYHCGWSKVQLMSSSKKSWVFAGGPLHCLHPLHTQTTSSFRLSTSGAPLSVRVRTAPQIGSRCERGPSSDGGWESNHLDLHCRSGAESLALLLSGHAWKMMKHENLPMKHEGFEWSLASKSWVWVCEKMDYTLTLPS